MKSRLLGAVCAVLFTLITVPADAALISRLGGAAAYDDVLDITWVTNASLSGAKTWENQVAWADSLSYLGFDDWRLASMSVAAGLPTGITFSVIHCKQETELACRDNELGYMYYHNLGGSFLDDLTGTQTVGDVTLTDIQSLYWSGTEFTPSLSAYCPLPICVWEYDFGFGGSSITGSGFSGHYGWAVRSGDVISAVPIPAAVWLFGSGLVGLLGIARRKKP